MAPPPRFRQLSREDFREAPKWFEPLFTMLNEALGALSSAIDHRLTRTDNLQASEKIGLEFTTKGSLAATWPLVVKNTLPTQPKHVWVTKLEPTNGASVSSAWSMTWKLNQSNQIELELQGLAELTPYRLSIAYE
jgi:hypothetical protein